MKSLVVALSVVTAIALVLALAGVGSGGQAPAPPPETRLAAAIDITPIHQELTAIRAELAALREAVTDAKGLRGDVTQIQTSLADLSQCVKKFSDAALPAIQALKPPQKWEYHILRNRNEPTANSLGTQGWELVTAAADWLIFKRPLDEGRPKPQE